MNLAARTWSPSRRSGTYAAAYATSAQGSRLLPSVFVFDAVEQPVEPLLESVTTVEACIQEGLEVGKLAALQEEPDVGLLQGARVSAPQTALTEMSLHRDEAQHVVVDRLDDR